MVRVRVRVRVRVGVRVRVRVGVRGEWKLCLRNVVWYGRAHARARCGVAKNSAESNRGRGLIRKALNGPFSRPSVRTAARLKRRVQRSSLVL